MLLLLLLLLLFFFFFLFFLWFTSLELVSSFRRQMTFKVTLQGSHCGTPDLF